MTPRFALTHLTRDPEWIEAADAAGIERIGIDIERIGKHARQAATPSARISDHELEDLRTVSAHCRNARPFARLNRPHAGTCTEALRALDCGARSLMLPGFSTADEAEDFIIAVGGRAEVILLVETTAAVRNLDAILCLPGIDEVMVGLNDMSLQLGMSGPAEVAASPYLESLASSVLRAGLPFGCGGVARPDRKDLPVDPDWLLARFIQLGAQSAWIARSFYNDGMRPDGLSDAVNTLRDRIRHWRAQPIRMLEETHGLLLDRIHKKSS